MMIMPNFVFANETNGIQSKNSNIVLDFRYYSYTLPNTSLSEVDVIKTVDSPDVIEYLITYKDDSKPQEVLRVDFNTETNSLMNTNSAKTRSTFFSKYYKIKSKSNEVVLGYQFKTRVDLYESGSFRAFYGADTPNLLVSEGITNFDLLNKVASIKSSTGKFPTSDLTFAFSANARTTTTYSSTTSVGAALASAGFSVTSTSYYYKIISDTGTISVYK